MPLNDLFNLALVTDFNKILNVMMTWRVSCALESLSQWWVVLSLPLHRLSAHQKCFIHRLLTWLDFLPVWLVADKLTRLEAESYVLLSKGNTSCGLARADLHLLVWNWSLGGIAYALVWLECSYDQPEGHPGKHEYTFLIRILSTSLTSVSIFSVFCYFRYLSRCCPQTREYTYTGDSPFSHTFSGDGIFAQLRYSHVPKSSRPKAAADRELKQRWETLIGYKSRKCTPAVQGGLFSEGS